MQKLKINTKLATPPQVKPMTPINLASLNFKSSSSVISPEISSHCVQVLE